MTKTQSSIEWLVTQYEIKFGASITKVMADEIALAKQKFEQEIIDTWVASAQYGMTDDSKINSDEPKIAKVYYDNKYRK